MIYEIIRDDREQGTESVLLAQRTVGMIFSKIKYESYIYIGLDFFDLSSFKEIFFGNIYRDFHRIPSIIGLIPDFYQCEKITRISKI